jgi:hypothetical protein
MHVVVNHLPIKADADWAEMAAKFNAFGVRLRDEFPKTRVAVMTKASQSEAILVIVFEDEATMKHVSSNVAAPWFAENIRCYLSGAVSRSAGEVIAGAVA